MRPVPKVFFLGLLIFLFSFLPLDLLCSPKVTSAQPLEFSQDELGREELMRRTCPDGSTVPFDRLRVVSEVEPLTVPERSRRERNRRTADSRLRTTASRLAEQEAIKAIIDDFLVNDDTIGGCDQYSPTVARAPSGNFVITWRDVRNCNYDIYAQRYDSSGAPIGSNFKVNDDAGTTEQDYPAIAVDGSGRFVITWQDRRNVNDDIYAQRYDSSGALIGSNFKVNDDVGSSYQQSPAIAIDGSNKFVITWEDYRNTNSDIYAQRYDSSGASIGSNFQVNDDVGTSSQEVPAIALDVSGKFVITWHDYRNTNTDIYAQRYDSSGASIGSNFKVNDGAGTSYEWSPDIVMDGLGRFIITWQDERSFNSDIYVQRYDSSGALIGSNFKVNDDVGTFYQYSPAIAIDGSNKFVITWQDTRNGNRNIYAQKCDSSGTSIGSNFKVNDDKGSSYQQSPAMAMNGLSRCVITWHDYRNVNSDIYAQRYDSLGTPLDTNFKVNDDVGTKDQSTPAIALNDSGNFVLAWHDYRNGNWDIYAQRYNSSGNAVGSNFKASDDVGAFEQSFATVAMDEAGNFAITWIDKRAGNSDIYAQRYNSSGDTVGSNFKVNDNVGTSEQNYPAIAMDGSGKFVITWSDYRNINSDIYAQRYDSLGAPLDTNFKVNDDVGTKDQSTPAIAMDSSGDLVIVWHDKRNGNWDIYAQRYDSSGNVVGSNFKASDDVGAFEQSFAAVAMDEAGNFVITWIDKRSGNFDIYGQRYDSLGNTVGSNFQVANPQYTSFAQQYPAVAANSSKIFYAWEDNRRSRGWDIFAKVVDWTWTKVEEEDEVNLPHSFELSQNYPNPFNPTTTIPFTVHGSQLTVDSPIHTSLKIYNSLGQLVRTLVDEEVEPGNHQVDWEGKDNSGKEVASGIYFYQLKTKDFTTCRKMVLLR